MFIWIITLIILGIVAGQMVNYLADVLPATRRFSKPVCSHCHASQGWLDYLRAKSCSQCHLYKTWRYWIVLAAYPLLAVYFYYIPSTRLGFGPGFTLLMYFGVVAVIDLEHRVILDQVSLVGACLALAIGFWLHGFPQTFFGGIAGFGIMFILYYTGLWYSRWVSRRRGQEEPDIALGFGDVNLGGILGLLLGWPGIVAGLLFAIIIGGVFSLVLIVILWIRRKWQPSMAIPYAPFLLLSAVLLLYAR